MDSIWEIEHVDLFKALCPHKYQEYSKNKHSFKQYSKHDFIYLEGDAANKVFLIDKGKIKIGYYTEDGTEVIKSILRKGEIFGERAILGLDKRNDFAQAIEDTRICVITKETLLDMMKSNDAISLSIYKFIGMRIKRVERRLEIMLFKDTKTRLLEFLEDLKKECKIEIEDGKTIVYHPYTQNDIAKLIGTSRPTLNILFNELRDTGHIYFQRNKIYFM